MKPVTILTFSPSRFDVSTFQRFAPSRLLRRITVEAGHRQIRPMLQPTLHGVGRVPACPLYHHFLVGTEAGEHV